VCGLHAGVAIVVRGGRRWRKVVTGVCTPVRLVVVVLGLVSELPELAGHVGPTFEPLVLVCFVSLMCEPFAHASASILLPFLFGPVVLALVFVGIGFGWGVVGLWFPAVILAIVTVIFVLRVRVLTIAVSHVGQVDSVE
jgi:hypothetical protein